MSRTAAWGERKAAILAALADGPKTSADVAAAAGIDRGLAAIMLNGYRLKGVVESRKDPKHAYRLLWALPGVFPPESAAVQKPAAPSAQALARAFVPPRYSMRGVIP